MKKLYVLYVIVLIMCFMGCGKSDDALLFLPPEQTSDYTSANIGTLKYVPAGSFQRDVTNTNISEVSAFRMSRHEITREQFLNIMGGDPSDESYSPGLNYPVQDLSWYQAIAFCNKLSIAEGFTPVYSVTGVDFETLAYADIPSTNDADWNDATADWDADGYRLPTEMEWMWAAMGATLDRSNGYTGTGINTTGYTKGYAGSTEAGDAQNDIDDYAWTYDNSSSGAQPVGIANANELGLYDMSGNVAEWIWDWFDDYPAGTLVDYRGPASAPDVPFPPRVSRGGGWDETTDQATVANRTYFEPRGYEYYLGFRVVRP